MKRTAWELLFSERNLQQGESSVQNLVMSVEKYENIPHTLGCDTQELVVCEKDSALCLVFFHQDKSDKEGNLSVYSYISPTGSAKNQWSVVQSHRGDKQDYNLSLAPSLKMFPNYCHFLLYLGEAPCSLWDS